MLLQPEHVPIACLEGIIARRRKRPRILPAMALDMPVRKHKVRGVPEQEMEKLKLEPKAA